VQEKRTHIKFKERVAENTTYAIVENKGAEQGVTGNKQNHRKVGVMNGIHEEKDGRMA